MNTNILSRSATSSSAVKSGYTRSVEAKIDEACAMYLAPVLPGTTYIEQLIAVGFKLREAEELGGDIPALADERRRAGACCFSGRSARRLLRFARHATAIRAANLTRVMEAENFALERESAANKKDDESATALTEPDVIAMVAEHERSIFNDMRRLPATDQSDFVANLLAKLTHLYELFEVPSH